MILFTTAEQFNALPVGRQKSFINEETTGHHMPHFAGQLIYPQYDVLITYERDQFGRLSKIECETNKQATQRLIMMVLAAEAMKATKYN